MTHVFLPLLGADDNLLRDVLDLNAEVSDWTSALDAGRLARLLAGASFAEVALDEGRAAAFLIGFDEEADYDSPNFLWFRERLLRFAYVDRVVTAPWAQGRGLASALYRSFASHAIADGRDVLACEISLTPPNPGSDAFHARLGFTELGRGEPHPGKSVRYLVRPLPWSG